jgi:hypothetical protein
VSLLEVVAALLLTFGSVLLIRALIAADRAFPPAEPSRADTESPAAARPLRRAA